jgi:N-glycosylase/DNA lyase
MKLSFADFLEAERVMRNFQKPKTDEEIFYNLMLVLMVPQSTFKNCMVALEGLKKVKFYNLPIDVTDFEYYGTKGLGQIIKPCRFYKRKAEYLLEAKKNFSEILWRLKYMDVRLREEAYSDGGHMVSLFLRDWLVKNIKGLGMKTASHLLRNMGATDLAIIDTHILKYLKVEGKWDYLDLERRLGKRAKRHDRSIAVLDIVVWHLYSKTEWSDYTY